MPGRFVPHQPAHDGSDMLCVHDTEHQELRALRTLDPASHPPASFSATRARIRRAARVRHPNLARWVASGEEDGRLHVVMEWLPGATLDQVGLVPVDGALSWIQDLADALAAAHAAGLAHGAIAPHRIALADDGSPKLMWLGVRPDAEARADVAALGALLDHLLPVQQPEVAALILATRDGDLVSARDLRDAVARLRRTLGRPLPAAPPAPAWRRAGLVAVFTLAAALTLGIAWQGFLWITDVPPPALPPTDGAPP